MGSCLRVECKASIISNYILGDLYSLGFGAYGIFQFNTSLDPEDIYAAYLAPVFYQRFMFFNLVSLHLGLGPTVGISSGFPSLDRQNNRTPAKCYFESSIFAEFGITVYISDGFGLGVTRTYLLSTRGNALDTRSLGVSLLFRQ